MDKPIPNCGVILSKARYGAGFVSNLRKLVYANRVEKIKGTVAACSIDKVTNHKQSAEIKNVLLFADGY